MSTEDAGDLHGDRPGIGNFDFESAKNGIHIELDFILRHGSSAQIDLIAAKKRQRVAALEVASNPSGPTAEYRKYIELVAKLAFSAKRICPPPQIRAALAIE